MKVSSVNTADHNRNNQTPSFGMKLVVNPELRHFIRTLKDHNASEKEVTGLFDKLNEKIDNSKILKFDAVKDLYKKDQCTYLGQDFFATISNDKFAEKFKLHISKRSNYSDGTNPLSNIQSTIESAANTLGEIANNSKKAYDEIISTIFKYN